MCGSMGSISRSALEQDKVCLLVSDRGARRRHQGTRGFGRWVSRVDRVLGRLAAVVPPPRDDRTGTHGRRRALAFWKALGEVFPDTREQRCWFHVSSNVLAAQVRTP